MTQPAHDVRVSPVEELKLKAQLEDDFGVVRHGLSYTAGRPGAARDRPRSRTRQKPAKQVQPPSTCSTSSR